MFMNEHGMLETVYVMRKRQVVNAMYTSHQHLTRELLLPRHSGQIIWFTHN